MKKLLAMLALLSMMVFNAEADRTTSSRSSSKRNVVAQKLRECDFLLNRRFKRNAKIYLCLFSASWCPPCRAEMPRIAKTYAETLKSDPDIELIHFSRDRDEKTAKAWAKEHNVKFPVVKPNGRNPLDLYANGIPRLFILKADGTLLTEGHPMRLFNEEILGEIKKNPEAHIGFLSKGNGSDGISRNFYLSAENGDDENPGTKGKPLRSLLAVSKLAKDGDTLHFTGGEFPVHADYSSIRMACVSLIGGYSHDFSTRNPFEHQTIIKRNDTGENAGSLLHLYEQRSGRVSKKIRRINVDGLAFHCVENPRYSGKGLMIFCNSSIDFTMKNCIFYEAPSRARQVAGDVFRARGGTVHMTDNVFQGRISISRVYGVSSSDYSVVFNRNLVGCDLDELSRYCLVDLPIGVSVEVKDNVFVRTATLLGRGPVSEKEQWTDDAVNGKIKFDGNVIDRAGLRTFYRVYPQSGGDIPKSIGDWNEFAEHPSLASCQDNTWLSDCPSLAFLVSRRPLLEKISDAPQLFNLMKDKGPQTEWKRPPPPASAKSASEVPANSQVSGKTVSRDEEKVDLKGTIFETETLFTLSGPYGIRIKADTGCEKGAEYVLEKLRDVYLPRAKEFYGDPFDGKAASRVYTITVERNDERGPSYRPGTGGWGVGLGKGSDDFEISLDYLASSVLTVCEEPKWTSFVFYVNRLVEGKAEGVDPTSRLRSDIRKGLLQEGERRRDRWYRSHAPLWAVLEELRSKHPTFIFEYCTLKNRRFAEGKLPKRLSWEQMADLLREVTREDVSGLFKKYGVQKQ